MVGPTQGEPEMPLLPADLNALGVPLMAIVEHDMYPAPADQPLPIAARTRRYYGSCGSTARPRLTATGLWYGQPVHRASRQDVGATLVGG